MNVLDPTYIILSPIITGAVSEFLVLLYCDISLFTILDDGSRNNTQYTRERQCT